MRERTQGPRAWRSGVGVGSGVGSTVAPQEFAHVRTLGQALVEHSDGLTHVVVAYYYSQRQHDSRWILLELGLASTEPTEVRRSLIVLVNPAGRAVRLAAQSRWAQDPERSRQLLQHAEPSRHQVGSYFPEARTRQGTRFFTRPDLSSTVGEQAGLGPDELLVGDLYFESPAGFWDRGLHALIIRHDRGVARLPIALR
jgi:hypothetical protein